MRRMTTMLLGLSLLVATPAMAQAGHMRGMWQQQDSTAADSVAGRGWQPGMGWYPGMMGMPMMGWGGGGMMGPQYMGRYMNSRGMMMGAGVGMMMGYGLPSATVILGMQQELGLSQTQVSQLQDIQNNAREAVRNGFTGAWEAQQEASSILTSKNPDMKAYRQKLQEAATDEVQAQVALANASLQARGVLTPDQQEQVMDGLDVLHGMFGTPDRGYRGMRPHHLHEPGS